MAGCEAAIERQPAIDHRRHTMTYDLDIGRTYRDRVDAHENLGRARFRNRLLNDRQLLRAAQDPSLHPIRNGVLVAVRGSLGMQLGHRARILCCRCGLSGALARASTRHMILNLVAVSPTTQTSARSWPRKWLGVMF